MAKKKSTTKKAPVKKKAPTKKTTAKTVKKSVKKAAKTAKKAPAKKQTALQKARAHKDWPKQANGKPKTLRQLDSKDHSKLKKSHPEFHATLEKKAQSTKKREGGSIAEAREKTYQSHAEGHEKRAAGKSLKQQGKRDEKVAKAKAANKSVSKKVKKSSAKKAAPKKKAPVKKKSTKKKK